MKIQIAGVVFLETLSIMKKTLDILKFKMGEKSPEFTFIRQEIMNYTYRGLQKLFKKLMEEKIIKKCDCGTNLRKGFKKCSCGGSGYINLEN